MSVTGEFLRSIRNYIDFLRPLDSEFARALSQSLQETERDARRNLSEAADRALELLCAGRADAGPLPEIQRELASALETEQHEFLSEHLVAISRAILGR